ncbi:MAG TPA: PepSY domain-containing protein [Steroidobacteraceae bacterium]|nr:PepSY domain-containing protein [Steroidobacteraceae bacterium]
MSATAYRIAATVVFWAMLTAVAAGSASAVHEVQSLTQAKVSLTEGIHLAEQHANGHAISASYEVPNGRPSYYLIEVLRGDGLKLTRYELSPNTGRVQPAGDQHLNQLPGRLKPAAVGNAPTSLAGAVQRAEERAGGKATGATIDPGGDRVNYIIDIARLDGSTQRVEVNGADGRVAGTD